MMTRRWFSAAASAFFTAIPPTVAAQPAAKVVGVGILGNLPRTEAQGADLWGAFVQGPREFGYVEGRNLTIEERSSEGRYERLPLLADELVGVKVDVIIVPADQNPRAAQQATRTIPIVAAILGDPVGVTCLSNGRPRSSWSSIAGGDVRRQDPGGREAGGPARRAAHDVRVDRQPQDGQGPWPGGSAIGARSRGQGHRVSGFLATLGRLGGNLTGLFPHAPEVAGKWLQTLRDAVPGR